MKSKEMLSGVSTIVADRYPDIHNAPTLSKREALSFERVCQEWQNTHEQLKIAIRNLPPEKEGSEFVFLWGQTGNIEDLVTGLTAEHFVSHLKDVQA